MGFGVEGCGALMHTLAQGRHGFMWGLGLKVVGFRVEGCGMLFRVWSLGLRVYECRVQVLSAGSADELMMSSKQHCVQG